MTKPLVISLLALALAGPAGAEEITTSRGMQHLPPALSLVTEPALLQASGSAEQILIVLMRDIAEIEKQRRSVAGDANAVAAKVKGERDAIEKLRVEYEAADKGYRDELAAFERDQANLEYETNQQRTQAASLEAVPSAQRDIKEVLRLNEWAGKLNTTRTQLEARRAPLQTSRDAVEAKRVALNAAKAKADSGLKDARGNVLGQAGSADAKLAATAVQLRACVSYLERIRGYWDTRLHKKPPASPLLVQAQQVLAQLDKR